MKPENQITPVEMLTRFQKTWIQYKNGKKILNFWPDSQKMIFILSLCSLGYIPVFYLTAKKIYQLKKIMTLTSGKKNVFFS